MSKILSPYHVLRRMKLRDLPSTLLITGALVDSLNQYVTNNVCAEEEIAFSIDLFGEEEVIRLSLENDCNRFQSKAKPVDGARLFLDFHDDGDGIQVMGALGSCEMAAVEQASVIISLYASRYKHDVEVALFIGPSSALPK